MSSAIAETYRLVRWEDVSLCSDEVSKLAALLRCSERYADMSRPPALWAKETIFPSLSLSSVGSSSSLGASTPDKPSTRQTTPGSTPSTAMVVPAATEGQTEGTGTPTVSGVNVVAQLVDLVESLRWGRRGEVDAMGVLVPVLSVVMDPQVSGHITAGALGGVQRMLQTGSRTVFLQNRAVASFIIDCVTKTRFTETDREHDESVLLRIIEILDIILVAGSVDKTRVAAGLQCMQTIWIQETHSWPLRDAARGSVFRILMQVIASDGGCEGYASVLAENVCLNIELLSRQPASLFDGDKLGFFVDILSLMSRLPKLSESMEEALIYQVMNALFWLLPGGPGALPLDSSSSGMTLRSNAAVPIASGLLAIGNTLLRRHAYKGSDARTVSALAVEALVSCMYLRPLLPISGDELGGSRVSVKAEGFAETAFTLMNSASLPSTGPSAGSRSTQVAGQTRPGVGADGVTVHAIVLEHLHAFLSEPDIPFLLWENFDCVWCREELLGGLTDSLVGVMLDGCAGEKSAGLEVSGREKILKTINFFYSQSAEPEADIPSYLETLAVSIVRDMLESMARSAGDAENDSSDIEAQLHMRLAAREAAKQIKAKPKKAHETALQFLREFQIPIPSPVTNAVPWLLRLLPMDFESLGEFFGQPTEISSKAFADFIKAVNLGSMDPEEALRSCLQSFRLPGEAQQIDRIVKEIAYEYFASHKSDGCFASPDAAYTFLFSVIILNTDQHNPQVKRRMELRDFLRNNRKINEGDDISEEVQTRVFNSIRASQIVTPRSGSVFCAPLKAKWRDNWYLRTSGYVPGHLESKMSKKGILDKYLMAKGYDLLLGASYVLSRDPRGLSGAVRVLESLADLGNRESVSADALSVLRKYAIESFATQISGILPNARSFACLRSLLGRSSIAIETVQFAQLLCLWSAYAPLVERGTETMAWSNLPADWAEILMVPPAPSDGQALSGGGIASLFRSMWQDEAELEEKKSGVSELSWRSEVTRSSFLENQPNAPTASQLLSLQQVGVDQWLNELVKREVGVNSLTQKMLDLICAAGSGDFWEKETARSSPWALFLVLRILAAAPALDLACSGTARDSVLAVLRRYGSNQLMDMRGLKLATFSAFGFVVLLAQRDPTSLVVDPGWLMPVLDELTNLASSGNNGPSGMHLISLTPTICMCMQMILRHTPSEWLERVTTPVWRELFRLLAALAGESRREVLLETAQLILCNNYFLLSFTLASAASVSNDINDCLVHYEALLGKSSSTVNKHLTELACKLAGLGVSGTGVAWTATVGRITARATAIAKQKKPTGAELNDIIELLRMCLGDPRAIHCLTTLQAGSTVEKCASTLSAVVVANTPPGALQAGLCVFVRFFLLALDKLKEHPQFDHIWLMSLRVVLLFIKRGHEDSTMEQLAEVTTETLRNALQVLLACSLLGRPGDESPHWWKVTWDIVETFCPGMCDDLLGTGDVGLEVVVDEGLQQDVHKDLQEDLQQDLNGDVTPVVGGSPVDTEEILENVEDRSEKNEEYSENMENNSQKPDENSPNTEEGPIKPEDLSM